MLFYSHSDGSSYAHGTTDLNTTTYTADFTDQRLVTVTVRYKSYLEQITFITIQPSTKKNFMYGPYGGPGGGPGFQIGMVTSIYGRSGTGIDKIGFRGSLFT